MKFIRWPFVSLILLGILFSFFYVGYFANSSIKNDLEFYSSEALSSIVRVGKLKLNVFHSVISGENIFVIDPGNKSKPAFRAKPAVVVYGNSPCRNGCPPIREAVLLVVVRCFGEMGYGERSCWTGLCGGGAIQGQLGEGRGERKWQTRLARGHLVRQR